MSQPAFPEKILVAKQVFRRNPMGFLSSGELLERRTKVCVNSKGHSFLCMVDIHENHVVVSLLLQEQRMLYEHFSCLPSDRKLMLTSAVQLLS